MADALVAADVAECDSFVQVCDQDEVRLAYLTIIILLCALFFACVCICKLYCSRKTSVSQSSPTVQSEPRPESTACAGIGESVVAPADKAYHTADPSIWESHNSSIWGKDIFVSSQLVENHYKPQTLNCHDAVHTERKYHSRRDCPALKKQPCHPHFSF